MDNFFGFKYPYLIIIRKVKFIISQRLECQNIFEEYNDRMINEGKIDKLLTEEDLVIRE